MCESGPDTMHRWYHTGCSDNTALKARVLWIKQALPVLFLRTAPSISPVDEKGKLGFLHGKAPISFHILTVIQANREVLIFRQPDAEMTQEEKTQLCIRHP